MPTKLLVVPKLPGPPFSAKSSTLPSPATPRSQAPRVPLGLGLGVGGGWAEEGKRPIPPVCRRAARRRRRPWVRVRAQPPSGPSVPAQVGRPEPALSPRTDKRPRRPAPPRRAEPEAAPPGQRGRCRRRYLCSPRRAGRVRGLQGGREAPGWAEATPGERSPNPPLSFPSLKRLSASLLLSSSPSTQRPPSQPCYGDRRGPIPAPLTLRLPELPSAARQPEATERPPAPASRAGPWWGLGGEAWRDPAHGAYLCRSAEPPRRKGLPTPTPPHRSGQRRAPPGAVPPPSLACPRLPSPRRPASCSSSPRPPAKPSQPPPPCSPAPA